MAEPSPPALQRTPLHALHQRLGGKLVPFAGYEMPVQYRGILDEHLHTRGSASLFDVSHMGQLVIRGADAAGRLERLVPGDIEALAPGRMRYTLFTNEAGGILDDLMVTRQADHLFVVVNASCKAADTAHLQAHLGDAVEPLPDRALLALQGPAAAAVMARLAPEAAALDFMQAGEAMLAGTPCLVTRSGYTGEDGFEISVLDEAAAKVAEALLAAPEVAPAGLGARDSLRLEAGLCLYGHDIDTATSPIEAGLAWTISKRRRGQGGFPGADVVQKHLAEGPPRRRIGLRPEGRVLAREGTPILGEDGAPLGTVTSGGFGPSVGGPVAMGYVAAAAAKTTAFGLDIRGTARLAHAASMPFVAHRYHRKPA